jgi:hypothetical protein
LENAAAHLIASQLESDEIGVLDDWDDWGDENENDY